MTRWIGSFAIVLVLAGIGVVRADAGRRADAILRGEARARAAVAALQAASARATADGSMHPGLVAPFLAAVPGLRPRPDLGRGEVSFAEDDVYLYGLQPLVRRDPANGRTRPGWVLRAWPSSFGRTGNREFQADDSDAVLEGQNRTGRSGTSYGFPPDFPAPATDGPRSGWWPLDSGGDHR